MAAAKAADDEKAAEAAKAKRRALDKAAKKQPVKPKNGAMNDPDMTWIGFAANCTIFGVCHKVCHAAGHHVAQFVTSGCG